MQKDAIFDESRKYRYVLKRQWGTDDSNFVNFILLNPSTADEAKDDRTIMTCIKLAKNLGYSGLWVTNLFAFRATKPTDLKKAADPIGDFNDQYLREYVDRSKIVIVAWGNHGSFLKRQDKIIDLLSGLKSLYCLGKTKSGKPKHPLYMSAKTNPFLFNS